MNNEYAERAKPLHLTIRTAWQTGLIAETLAGLTDLAALMVEAGKTSEAATVLAFVMRHPDTPYDTFDHAEDLFIDLEGRLCPRAIEDAKELALIQTLRSAIEAATAV